MRIGILTYHNTLNFGAALQCYALYKCCTNFGVEVEIIDYRNYKIEKTIKPLSVVTQRGKNKIDIKGVFKFLFIYPLMNSKKNSFYRFNNKYMKFSSKIYLTRSEILENPPIYDKYIIGSDQVWNYNINGMDSTYLMDFVSNKNKIFTFASSFGLEMIEEDKQNIYRNLLSSIPIISVREQKAAEIVYKLTGNKAQVICDPVFLLTKQEWLYLLELKALSKKNIMCTYFLNINTRERFESELIKKPELAKLKNSKLAGGIKARDFINKNISVNLSKGPLEFIKDIYEAKYVLTDSFHATVFAIILNTKFMVFLSGNKGRDSRIINLLKLFEMEDRIYVNGFENIDNEIDLNKTNNICKLIRIEAIEFLKKNLIF